MKDSRQPLGLTRTELARRIHVPIERVNQIVKKGSVTPDTAPRLFSTATDRVLSRTTRATIDRAYDQLRLS